MVFWARKSKDLTARVRLLASSYDMSTRMLIELWHLKELVPHLYLENLVEY